MENEKLKKELIENIHYTLLPKKAWENLYEWYNHMYNIICYIMKIGMVEDLLLKEK